MDRTTLIQRLKQRSHKVEEHAAAYTHQAPFSTPDVKGRWSAEGGWGLWAVDKTGVTLFGHWWPFIASSFGLTFGTQGWKVVTDASLSHGLELVAPILKGREGLAEVMRMCDSLDALGIEIDTQDSRHKEYGFHVHIDVSDLDGEAVSRLICFHHHIEEQGLIQCVARSRRDSRWCKQTHASILAKASSGPLTCSQARSISNDRYVALNMFGRCAEYGTVEFRRHGGTLKDEKAVAWIIHCLCMVSASASKRVDRTSGQGLKECFKAIGMYDNDTICTWAAEYLLKRQSNVGRSGVEYPEFPNKASFLQLRA